MTNITPLSTEVWIRAALERYEERLVRYARRITGDAETARDVVQDAFVKLCRADRAKIEDHLAPWLYAVTRNRALDVAKKEGRTMPLTDERAAAQPGGEPPPDDHAQRNETRALVLEALAQLPEREREAFRLKFEDDLTYREIGKIMGVSLGTVSNLVSRALDAIRTQLRAKIDLAQEAPQ